ncbi:MAG TPA: AMP nucleosidase, partial [Rhodanobacteraceae bacterium]|nr:AMP nucleosidase [Rhodanobacteraceae bacterium]
MKEKSEIVGNWLPRYTGAPLDALGQYVLLTNFGHYVERFAEANAVPVLGRDRPMPNATVGGI